MGFTKKQQQSLQNHFKKNYKASEMELKEMFNKLQSKGRISEKWYRLEKTD